MTKLPLPPPETRDQMIDFFPQPVAPTVPCSEMSIFAEGLDHPEGLAFDADGALWAGGEAGQIYRIVEGRTELVGNLGGFCLGLTVSRKQELFVCNLGLHVVQRLDQTGRVLATLDRVNGHKLETPNFSVFDSEGNLYCSDSGQWNASIASHFSGPETRGYKCTTLWADSACWSLAA
jgi:sugar lactone lactonase YvrE